MLPKAFGKRPFAWCMRATQGQSPLFIVGTVYMFGSIWQGSHPLKAPTETNWPIPNLQESWSIPCRRPLCTSWPVAQNLVYSSLIQLYPFIPSSLHAASIRKSERPTRWTEFKNLFMLSALLQLDMHASDMCYLERWGFQNQISLLHSSTMFYIFTLPLCSRILFQ